jgi:fatty acid desaturase
MSSVEWLRRYTEEWNDDTSTSEVRITKQIPINEPVSTLTATFVSLPWAMFRRNPRFYLYYDSIFAAFALTGMVTLISSGYRGPFYAFDPVDLLWLPVFLFVLIQAHTWTHIATHNALPRSINRIVGEVCGALVLTKFASWEIVHRRHHRYSDDAEKDPHPVERSYWRFALNTLIKVEQQLQASYFEIYGDTPANRRYEKIRSLWSFVSGVLMALFFGVVLGPAGFFMLYVPAFVGAALFVIHFNWVGHNAHTKDGKIEPVNLDHGWFWLGNRLFFGIYYHGNHHRRSMLVNPMNMPVPKASRARAEGVGK